MNSILRVDNLSAGYGKDIIINGISLEVFEGEIAVLIGPNGGGKSTFLKAILGEVTLFSGNVYICDNELKSISAKERSKKIAMLSTQRLDLEHITVYEVVAMGRYPYTGFMGVLTDDDRSVIERAMERTSIAELKDKYYDQLSDGQKQRVMLTRAICQEPKLLIMDEPTSYLDINHKIELLYLLKKLSREEGMTILMTLHDIEYVNQIADKVWAISKDGKLCKLDTNEAFPQSDSIRKLFNINIDHMEYING